MAHVFKEKLISTDKYLHDEFHREIKHEFVDEA